MNRQAENLKIQKKLTAVTIAMFVVKITAWVLTGSIAIFTDALEYTINLVSGFVGLYSLHLSTKPRDENHPYGHGKVEFLSAAVEGTLMVASGFFIIYGAVHYLKDPAQINKLDYGIFLVAITAAVNYIVGAYAAKKGKQNDSLPLIATGKHMQTDTYATLGIIIGLILIFVTGQYWLDSVVAILFALIIMFSGYKILRSSIAGIMDEADDALLKKLVALLQSNRRQNWIDMHNLRIIKYGGTLHLDCHLTVPWYLNVHDAHKEIDELARLVRINFGESVELFVHTDGCLTFSCPICTKEDCPVRQHDFVKQIAWTVDNISSNNKHKLEENYELT